jgi:glycosyltransferase involved in cell wall biosynthesis
VGAASNGCRRSVRILHVNKFLYRRGGAEAYMLDLAALQSREGHEVEFFSMAHQENQASRFERYFPEYRSFRPQPDSLIDKVKVAGRLLYSPAARRGIEIVLEEFVPDVVHLHNIYHQLSPSILQPLRALGIPAVMTLHDYKLACPTYLFLDKGQLCEACLGGHFYQAVLRRCNDGSLLSSSLNALELTVHTAMHAYAPVGVFACPSRFVVGKMTAAGVFPDRLRHIPHFVDARSIDTKERAGGSVVYAGRLSKEKGVDTLIEAAAMTGLRVEIAGTGPDAAAYEALARARGADGVRFLGHLPREELHQVIRSAAVLAIPSRCHENQPVIVLEAFACGVPAVASQLGGLPELIDPGVDGELVPHGDAEALAGSLQRFVDDPARSFEMGRAGRAKVLREFTSEKHLIRLGEIYREAAGRMGESSTPLRFPDI